MVNHEESPENNEMKLSNEFFLDEFWGSRRFPGDPFFYNFTDAMLLSIIRSQFGRDVITEKELLDIVGKNSFASMAWEVLCWRYGGTDAVKECICPSNCYLTTDERIIAQGVRLAQFCVTGAVLRGAWIDFGERVMVCCCYTRRTSDELGVQLQAKFSDYLKCVHVVFRQAGDDVVARADWAAYTSPEHNVGYDFESEYSRAHDDHSVPIAANSNANGYGVVRLRYCILSELQPSEMPVMVYKGGEPCPWHSSGMGNVEDLKVDTVFRDGILPLPCMRVEYASREGWSGVLWQGPKGDWGDRPGGYNMSMANTLFFRARGEAGGEKVNFGIGGLMNKMVSDTADRVLADVVLTKEWKTYRIELGDLDLSRIKTGFRFWFAEQGRPIVFYVANVFYDHVEDSCLSGISRNTQKSLLERAEIGDRVAMYELGVREEYGNDYAPCAEAAKQWYLKAACAGEPRAAEALKRLL